MDPVGSSTQQQKQQQHPHPQHDAHVAITSKRVVYVGGLADKATASGLRSAFIPFGTIQSVDVVRSATVA
jgi:RNA recognition motif-containing protein